jgi:hypothetical protein
VSRLPLSPNQVKSWIAFLILSDHQWQISSNKLLLRNLICCENPAPSRYLQYKASVCWKSRSSTSTSCHLTTYPEQFVIPWLAQKAVYYCLIKFKFNYTSYEKKYQVARGQVRQSVSQILFLLIISSSNGLWNILFYLVASYSYWDICVRVRLKQFV